MVLLYLSAGHKGLYYVDSIRMEPGFDVILLPSSNLSFPSQVGSQLFLLVALLHVQRKSQKTKNKTLSRNS